MKFQLVAARNRSGTISDRNGRNRTNKWTKKICKSNSHNNKREIMTVVLNEEEDLSL